MAIRDTKPHDAVALRRAQARGRLKPKGRVKTLQDAIAELEALKEYLGLA